MDDSQGPLYDPASPEIMLPKPVPNASDEDRIAYFEQRIKTYEKEAKELETMLPCAEEGQAKAVAALTAKNTEKEDMGFKTFAIKTRGKAPLEYTGGTWYDWDQYINEMESQFTQNQVDAVSKEPIRSRRKIAYAETFLQKWPRAVWKNRQRGLSANDQTTWDEYKQFLLTHVDGYEYIQEDMQKEYKNMKQLHTEKVKKYVERFDLVLSRLDKSRRRGDAGELQDFLKGLRIEYQIELLKHQPCTTRQELIETVMRLESAEHRPKKSDKDDNETKGFKRTSNNSDDSKSIKSSKKPKGDHVGKKDTDKKDKKKGRNVKTTDLTNQLWRRTFKEHAHSVAAGSCLGCGKPGHAVKDCTNKQEVTRTREEAFTNPDAAKN